ncbi:hypothetical protein D3C71_2042080 [compost metagenome]
MALAAKMPREWRHVLRDQFGFGEIDPRARLVETLIQLAAHGQRPWLVGREAADVGDDQPGIGSREEICDLHRGVYNPLQIVDRALTVGRVIGHQVQ